MDCLSVPLSSPCRLSFTDIHTHVCVEALSHADRPRRKIHTEDLMTSHVYMMHL
jgi:hypothetical protein